MPNHRHHDPNLRGQEREYDLPRLRAVLAPAQFDVIFELEYYNHDFNWFDLVRRG